MIGIFVYILMIIRIGYFYDWILGELNVYGVGWV